MGAAEAVCEPTVTELSPDAAHAVLEPFYLALCEQFVDAGLKRCQRVKFYCAPGQHDTPRHFGATSEDGREIVVAPELAELPVETVSALIAHELGHAVDFLYPGEWVLGREREAIRRKRAPGDDEQWERWMRAWKERDADVIEFTADAIAEWATGRRIGYLGPCLLQAFDKGQARPAGLR